MPSFTIYAALRARAAVDDAVVGRVTAALRPGDDDMRVWREPDRAVVRASTEVTADDPAAALELARALGDDLAGCCPGDVEEAAALGDDDSLVWRAWL
ncbi:hypothetical protein [Blastococcus sp. TF02A-30]|uniref:hypothetical protein n=1 Tax=Blastococcus sp. TF02A-30 TaxID=2250580 RepID=UPI000DE86A1F|nr:hypothetical protein [Blastococcus sp. TF02A-30]RBY93186.1 hypothetical protein DQ241_04030 [Blastococcus sp. TF02A-30]